MSREINFCNIAAISVYSLKYASSLICKIILVPWGNMYLNMTISMEKSMLNCILATLLDKIVFLGPKKYNFWTRIVRACQKMRFLTIRASYLKIFEG